VALGLIAAIGNVSAAVSIAINDFFTRDNGPTIDSARLAARTNNAPVLADLIKGRSCAARLLHFWRASTADGRYT
jgi:hypothetical protein